MSFTRRTAVKALAAAGAVSALGLSGIRSAQAAEFSYKVGTGYPAGHPVNLQLDEAARIIKEKSGGRMEVLVFPASQLGADSDMLTQVRSGALEIYTTTNIFIGTLAPAASIASLPFAFPDYGKVWGAMDGKLGGFIRDTIGRMGLHVMDTFWDNGFRQVTTASTPIKKVEDLVGLKVRVPVSPLNTSLFTALGAAPVAMNFNELYSALQTGIVDGQENPLAVVDAGKLFEVQKNCSLTNHIWDGSPVLFNPAAWKALPDDLKAIVATALNEAGMRERAIVADLNAKLRAKLEKDGMTFNEVDTAPFRAKLSQSGFYADWKAKYGEAAWAVLEESVGKLV